MIFGFIVLLSVQASIAAATKISPTVGLDNGIFTGVNSDKVDKFMGIPFALPPVGNLRFRLPQQISTYKGSFNATAYGPACPQQKIKVPILMGIPQEIVDYIVNFFHGVKFPDSEDCLTINIIKPASATSASRLPVVVWIYGGTYWKFNVLALELIVLQGGFQNGSPSSYDGGVIVRRSIELGQPVIYVSMDYRATGFGFMASKEVKAAGIGNLGLQDQREAFRWIQKYIGNFGGDPTKVTIWGESAGAISVALHMLTNDGGTEGLFRAAFMQSGSPFAGGDINNGQPYYDAVVSETGCSGASDTLECLRTVPYKTLKAAIDKSPGLFSYQSLRLAWAPRVDGIFLKNIPQSLVHAGLVANIPFVSGDCDDEGTYFSFSSLNVTTEKELRTYINTTLFPPGFPDSDLNQLLTLYPADITQGSPYNTSILNTLTPQFKRIASLQGDAVFQGPRRVFMQTLASRQNVWGFLSKRHKLTPFLGSAHGTDIPNIYGGGELTDYLIRFVNNMDPNGPGSQRWPQYTMESPSLLTFHDGLHAVSISDDTYRAEPVKFLYSLIMNNTV
ncbi:carotenoid ester lipase precursor [Mycena floridula]|nr:carotenoid ester lipase precursor [Mycena floridula]